MENPHFSVVIPVFNKKKYVQHAIESVLHQENLSEVGGVELIVVDDGSTDGSYKIAEQTLQNVDIKTTLIRKENGGVSSARNLGAKKANGTYICFLDADDWWEPTFLQEINILISQYPEAALYGTNYYLIKNGKKHIAPIGLDKGFELGYINYYRTYMRTMCMPITSSSVAVRRDYFNMEGGFNTDITFGEDFDLWIRLSLKYKVALINKPLANYFQDQPIKGRATRRLHQPKSHMVWHFDQFSSEEANNRDLKKLLDSLRCGCLYRYYISRTFHNEAMHELSKIDWSQLPAIARKKYDAPLLLQRCIFTLTEWGVAIKKSLLLTLKTVKLKLYNS